MNFGKYIAHRGLHDKNVPENSLVAFEKAASAGVAAELDVRMTKDCRLVVFHDSSLARMCGIEADIKDFTYEQLSSFRLGDSDEKIPLLSQVLKLVDGRIPLLIEVKDGAPLWELEKRLYHMLRGYKGEYAVESFDPISLFWFRLYAPEIFRGQLISTHPAEKGSKYLLRLICAKPFVWKFISKPNFIACDLRSMSLETAFQAVDVNADLYTWTANSPELLETAAQFSKTVIAENFPEGFDFRSEDSDED